MEPVDHDRLFKELITTFFAEFMDLFLPDAAPYLDRDSFVFLDKEVFTDVTSGEKHEADIIVRAKFKETEAFFLIHVENQAKAQGEFGRRMFRYFARLHEKYALPIYPVVVFSYDLPRRREPDRYRITLPGRSVLDFRYRVIQLNRLPWRGFLRQSNPVASALMARMKFAARDRPRVKLECLRLLATLRLDPARTQLISGFVDTYLRLNTTEMMRYQRGLAGLEVQEQEDVMVLTTSWKEEGIQQGIQQGIAEGLQQGEANIVLRLLHRKFGPSAFATGLGAEIRSLDSSQLEALSDALLDFTHLSQLTTWLTENAS
ncbi:MAG: DUF4351 domain-containing protein [Cytophagales bacterium]|nr:DUF4351 domain-containing protein [Armatimonadota bacterium]